MTIIDMPQSEITAQEALGALHGITEHGVKVDSGLEKVEGGSSNLSGGVYNREHKNHTNPKS